MSAEPAPPSAPDTAAADAESAPPVVATPEVRQAEADKLVAEGKKAIALKQWEEGVLKLGDALEITRELVDDFDPKMAPLLYSYGRALYELASSQAGVLGKEEPKDEPQLEAESSTAAPGGPIESSDFVDEEEAADDEPAAEGAETAGDTSVAQSAAPEGEEADEPEDDYQSAWENLDYARAIYLKQVESLPLGEEGRDVRLALADCYLALGDVSMETENFPQAVQDLQAALSIKSKLLGPSSRALASLHLELAIVLEYIPAQRPAALEHVEKAVAGCKLLESELSGSAKSVSPEVEKLSAKEREAELADVKSLLGDLEVKLEELRAAPPAGDLVSESINHLLGGMPEASGSGSGEKKDTGLVNDLTGMVKKKKKPAAAPTATANGAAAAINGAVAEASKVASGALEKGKEVAEKVAEAAGKVVEGIEGGLAQAAEEAGVKRKAEEAEEAEEGSSKKAKAE